MRILKMTWGYVFKLLVFALKLFKENFLLITTQLIFLILIFSSILEKISIIPDILKLSKINSQNYFGLIISTIASIFGILIAFVLLAVEVLKEKLNRNNHTNPLDNELIRNVILNSVNLIFISFFSYIYFEDFSTSKSITIGYFIGIIFIIYIFSIFHVLKEIISNTSLIKRNVDLIDSLSYEDFIIDSKNKYLTNYKESSLKQYKKEIDYYILNNNTNAYESLNNKIVQKVVGLISIDLDKRDKFSNIFSSLTWIWRENCKTAVRVNDSNYFDNIWVSIELLYSFASEKKVPLVFYYEIWNFIYFDLTKFYKTYNNTISLSKGLNSLDNSLKRNLEYNCPKQEDLWELLDRYEGRRIKSSTDDSIQWDRLKGLLSLIIEIQSLAVDLNEITLFKECNNKLNMICYDIAFDLQNLETYQKSDLILKIIRSSTYNSSLLIKKNNYGSTLDFYEPFDDILISVIEKNIVDERCLRAIFILKGNYLFDELKLKRLHTDNMYGTFSSFYIIGKLSIKKYHEKSLDKNIVDYFISFFELLKDYIEDTGVDRFELEYKNIKSALGHFIAIAKDDSNFIKAKNPLKKWIKIEKSFKKIDYKKVNANFKWEIE